MCLSSASRTNGGSDPDAAWHNRSEGPWIRQIVGFEDRSTGRIILGANMGRPIVTNGGLFTIKNSHCAAAKLLLAEFSELQARRAG